MKKTATKPRNGPGGKRLGAGRPTKFGPGAEYLTLRFPATLCRRLEREAKKSGRSLNEIVVGVLVHRYYGVDGLLPPEAE